MDLAIINYPHPQKLHFESVPFTANISQLSHFQNLKKKNFNYV